MASHSVGLSLVMVISLATVGFAIKCFQCNSAEYPECNDLSTNDTDNALYQKCDGEYHGHLPFCRKIETHVMYVENSKRIVRACGWIGENNDSKDKCTKGDTDFIKKITCSCFTDGCNSSNVKVPYGYLNIFVILAIIFHIHNFLA